MLCVPTPRLEELHSAVRTLPLPPSATALQPAIATPPSVKLTVPVGASPVTVAVKVTPVPTTAGFAELRIVVPLDAAVITWEIGELLDAPLPASPL